MDYSHMVLPSAGVMEVVALEVLGSVHRMFLWCRNKSGVAILQFSTPWDSPRFVVSGSQSLSDNLLAKWLR